MKPSRERSFSLQNRLKHDIKTPNATQQNLFDFDIWKSATLEDPLDEQAMIAVTEPVEFTPFGREYCASHPGSNSLLCGGTKAGIKNDIDLPLGAFREITIEDHAKREFWQIRQSINGSSNDGVGVDRTDHDEEIYIKGNILVWSKGCHGQARSVQKSYTMDSPILQAQWITFWLQPGNKADVGSIDIDTQPVDPVHSVCLSQANSLTVFGEQGDEFAVSLPFQISKTWAINRGMILERSVSHLEIASPKRDTQNLPTLFSLLHPLDEPAPIIFKSGAGIGTKVNFMTDYTQQIVFTSKDPSLIVTFDTAMGLHSVWLLRQAKTEEICVASKILNTTTAGISTATTPYHLSTCSSGTLAGLSASAHSRLSASSVSPGLSPFRSYPSRTASPLMFSSRPQSPSMSLMAALSRSQSPMNSMVNTPGFNSPASRLGWSPALMHSMDTTCGEVSEPLTPDLCMDHCWTEPITGHRSGILGKATKVFLTSDLCEQHYLVYLIESKRQLKIVRFSISNDSKQLIFGNLITVPAKDAVPVESLNMMVVLDLNGSMILYTGIVKMGKVLVSGILPTTLSASSGAMPRPSTPLDSPMMPMTSSRPSSAAQVIMDEVVMLSPVATPGGDMGDSNSKLQESTLSDDFAFHGSGGGSGKHVTALMDAVANRFTLELSDSTMLRTSLPNITSSPIISLCLEAIKYVIPKDLALQLMSKWYTTHNAPGGPSSQSEWFKFSECLLGMMGYDTSKLGIIQRHDLDSSLSPVIAAKKHKASGLDEDWEFLLSSNYHQDMSSSLLGLLGINCETSGRESLSLHHGEINESAPLFQFIPSLMFALHLVYEELKLDRSHAGCLDEIVTLLCQLARDLDWISYVEYYFRCHQNMAWVAKQPSSQVSTEHRAQMQYPTHFSSDNPPSIYGWIYSTLRGKTQEPYPYLENICRRSQEIIMLYTLYFMTDATDIQVTDKILRRLSAAGQPVHQQSTTARFQQFLQTHLSLTNTERVILFMTDRNITMQTLDSLPFGVALPLLEVIHQCHENPPSNWPEGAYALMGRQDLSAQAKLREKKERVIREPVTKQKASAPADKDAKESKKEENDGMEHLDDELLRLRFPDDLRIQEVRRLLQSSRPARINLTQKPEVSDHDFIEEQEMRLLMVSQRTMALPVGRGMFTLCTSRAVVTETLPIPKLNLGGRAPPRNQTINFLHIDVPSNIHHWPLFHNGVAAGLKIAPGCSQIDSTWIVYNKPAGSELTYDHAGFLMALGLNGHLSNLTTLKVHDYLCKGHEITSVGLLLGLAAAKRGTMDVSTTKMLSIHIAALLPPTSTELDVPHIVQVAAIMGVGLVYQVTAHRHIAEVLLGEIGRPPGPELENCTDRESYSLTAGLALGMVMLGHGSDAIGLSDLNMADQLYHYMAGGHKKQPAGAHREKFKSPCYQIKEGDQVNIDVTSPGATLALGLMFFKTGNQAVAQWLAAPDTQFLLDFVKPDFLLLRTISRGLVLWNDVRPTSDWIQSNVPEIVKKYAFHRSSAQDELDGEIDFQTMSQAECNILAGACLVLGLRFAGSANNSAFNTLLHYAKRCYSLSTQPVADLVGKSTIETCLNAVMISLALVMAGTGNLDVLRLTRQLHCRISVDVPYGSHMAIHQAIGLLFLGGGRYTLSTSGPAIAALLCSIYPRFPENSSDNRYHLQALRHLYVLASEPRLILPKDVDSTKPCYAPIEIVFKGSPYHEEKTVQMLAPCIIPELKHLKRITVMGPRYLQIVLDVEKDAETLKSIFEAGGMVYVKQRAGHLSYEEDPKGYHSQLAHSFTQDGSGHHGGMNSKVIRSFTSDPKILTFAQYFCQEHPGETKEDGFNVVLASYLHECVTKEKPHMLPILAEVYKAMESMLTNPSPYLLWQLKLLLAYYDYGHPRMANHEGRNSNSQSTNQKSRKITSLVNTEMCASVASQVELNLESWLQDNIQYLVRYLFNTHLPDIKSKSLLPSFLLYHDIPSHLELSQIPLQGCSSLPEVCDALQNFNLPISGLLHILTALQYTNR